jgi:hypothetical protein
MQGEKDSAIAAKGSRSRVRCLLDRPRKECRLPIIVPAATSHQGTICSPFVVLHFLACASKAASTSSASDALNSEGKSPHVASRDHPLQDQRADAHDNRKVEGQECQCERAKSREQIIPVSASQSSLPSQTARVAASMRRRFDYHSTTIPGRRKRASRLQDRIHRGGRSEVSRPQAQRLSRFMSTWTKCLVWKERLSLLRPRQYSCDVASDFPQKTR